MKSFPALLCLTFVVIGLPSALAQKRAEADQTREAFFNSRKNTSPKTARKGTAPQRKQPLAKATHAVTVEPVGLGYTLLKQGADGTPVRVSAGQVFHEGERLRLMIEPKVSGYLYIFSAENNGTPELIFPNPRLQNGENRVAAHVLYEMPSSNEPRSENRWFAVQGAAATEHLYLIISRTPLEDVPTGKALVTHCGGKADCAWQPEAAAWGSLVAKTDAAVTTSQEAALGQRLALAERHSLERHIGLPPSAPAPAVIKMNRSVQDKLLITVMDLIHK